MVDSGDTPAKLAICPYESLKLRLVRILLSFKKLYLPGVQPNPIAQAPFHLLLLGRIEEASAL